ncbi:MAG: hypothetical protein K6T78_15900 [Alicyclobacillus sp.]|nr:hypothetical protein [Alicyclobacillus sp.]
MSVFEAVLRRAREEMDAIEQAAKIAPQLGGKARSADRDDALPPIVPHVQALVTPRCEWCGSHEDVADFLCRGLRYELCPTCRVALYQRESGRVVRGIERYARELREHYEFMGTLPPYDYGRARRTAQQFARIERDAKTLASMLGVDE